MAILMRRISLPKWWWSHTHLISPIIIILPFAYYVHLVASELWPFVGFDSFTYLWDAPISPYFFVGRSLTQRLFFWGLNNNPESIAIGQTILFSIVALTMYLTLRRGRAVVDIPLAILISILFSSYSLSIFGITICSEPIHLALFLGFGLLYSFNSPTDGFWKSVTVAVFGCAFIFSKSVAPFATIALVISASVLMRHQRCGRQVALNVFLSIVSLCSILITQIFDTSVHINIANNLYARIFPYPERVTLFSEKYGMPTGRFIQACAHGNVNTPCIGGVPIYTVDHINRNYQLENLKHRLIHWIKKHGSSAMTRFFLFDGLGSTVQEFSKAYTDLTMKFGLTYTSDYFEFYHHPGTGHTNLELLTKDRPSKAGGFFGFEPWDVLRKFNGYVGWGSLTGVALYGLAALIIVLILPTQSQHKFFLGASLNLLIFSLAAIFIGHFGDGMDLIRHTYLYLTGLLLAQVFCTVLIAQCVLLRIFRWWYPKDAQYRGGTFDSKYGGSYDLCSR